MTLYAVNGISPTLPDDGDFWIAPDANVIGNVTICSGASIWFGCTLRGDNEPIVVGQGSNVQENCVLHTDMGFPLVIGVNCTIGHKAMLHGCTICNDALVGMGATVLNGAVVGGGALVGAGAVVTEGKTVPPGMLAIGAPAKPVRALGDADQAMIKAGANHYMQRMREFRDSLVALPPQ